MRLGGHVPSGIAFDKTSEDKLQVGSTITLATTRTPFLYIYGDGLQLDKILEIDNKVDRNEVGNTDNKIPRLINGKLSTTILPDLSITSVQTVTTKQDAQNLVTSGQIQVGDVVVVENDNNAVYMHNGNSLATFDDNFLELNVGTGTIKELNGLRPQVNGQLTIDATHIKLDGQNSQTVKQEIDTLKGRVDNCVIRVNGQTPAQGNVTLNGTHIDATINGDTKTIQNHLSEIGNGLNSANARIHANALKSNTNENEILKLKQKHPVYHVGDMITTTYKTNDTYILGDFEFLYMGKSQIISRNLYSELFNTLGVPSTQSTINAPQMSDTTLTYDINKRATVRHYICARKIR